MEHRENGLLVDFSGQALKTTNEVAWGGARRVVIDERQDREIPYADQDTRLFRAMNELRPITPSKEQWRRMPEWERDAFRTCRESVFRKYKLTPNEFNM
jgi:hypothetical protein